MKSFVIFPTICIFLLTAAILRAGGLTVMRKSLLSGLTIAIVTGLILTYFSTEMFLPVYFANFILIIPTIFSLTYLFYSGLKTNNRHIGWLKVLGLGILSAALVLTIFGTSFFFSLAHNPMDPAPKHLNSDKRED